VDSSDSVWARVGVATSRQSADEWAGLYYYGDHLGDNVALALEPGVGFTMVRHGCEGLYGLSLGAVDWSDSLIVLEPSSFDSLRVDGMAFPSSYIRIRWGRRHYLIASDEVIPFCNWVNAGREPDRRFASAFLLKDDDEKIPVSGFPRVPKAFRQYLVRKPVHAEIIKVLSRRTLKPEPGDSALELGPRTVTRVAINAGGLEGLHPGMELHVVGRSTGGAALIVLAVGDHEAIGEFDSWFAELHPDVSWKLSTRDPLIAALRSGERRRGH
jgi:hypothetical protein